MNDRPIEVFKLSFLNEQASRFEEAMGSEHPELVRELQQVLKKYETRMSGGELVASFAFVSAQVIVSIAEVGHNAPFFVDIMELSYVDRVSLCVTAMMQSLGEKRVTWVTDEEIEEHEIPTVGDG